MKGTGKEKTAKVLNEKTEALTSLKRREDIKNQSGSIYMSPTLKESLSRPIQKAVGT